jgi:hypothetical protein
MILLPKNLEVLKFLELKSSVAVLASAYILKVTVLSKIPQSNPSNIENMYAFLKIFYQNYWKTKQL